MDDEAKANIRLEILRMLMESGSAQMQADPLPRAEEWYEWVISKGHKPSKAVPKDKAA